MNLVLDSRFISFALRISDARKQRDGDQDEAIENADGGRFEQAHPFGYHYYENLGEGDELDE